MDLLQFGFSLGVFWPPPSAFFSPLTQITKMSKMLFVQWDTHLRLFSLLGDANQHRPWNFSLYEEHEAQNEITRVDTVILKWCFTPSVSGIKPRGAAPSLAYKGFQVPQAPLLQQRKWCWSLFGLQCLHYFSTSLLQCLRFLVMPSFQCIKLLWCKSGWNRLIS